MATNRVFNRRRVNTVVAGTTIGPGEVAEVTADFSLSDITSMRERGWISVLDQGDSAPTGAAGGQLTGTYPNPNLASSVAGAGLTGGAGSPLAVGAGAGVTVNANDVAVNYGLVAAVTGVEAGDAAAAGVADLAARIDHQHAVTTAAPATGLDPTTTNADGVATSLARSDHGHAVATALVGDITAIAPDNATAAGTANTYARGDHRHGIAANVASGLTSATANAEGSANTLARSDHTHAITALTGASAGTVAQKAAGALVTGDFGLPFEMLLTVPAGVTGDLDFTGAPFAFRVTDSFARKVGASADAGDTVQLQTAAGVAITNAMGLNVVDDALVRATSIDAASHEIAAAGTLRVRRAQSTDAACVVHVRGVRVA